MTAAPSLALYCRACCGGFVTGQRACWGTCGICAEWMPLYLVPARPLPGLNVERSQA